MRFVRYASNDASQPRLALERDGQLFDVADLEEQLRITVRAEPASDFRTRIAVLRCAGLDELDRRLLRGQRPPLAFRDESRVMRLAPCDVERCHFVRVAGPSTETDGRISVWLGDARSLSGPAAYVSPAGRAPCAWVVPCIAAMLGDELFQASEQEALRAIVGFSVMNDWWFEDSPPDDSLIRPPSTRAQLGPALVSPDEVGPLERLVARVYLGEALRWQASLAHTQPTVAQAIALASQHYQLRPGDVVGLTIGNLPATLPGTLPDTVVRDHDRAVVEIDRIGRLDGLVVPAR